MTVISLQAIHSFDPYGDDEKKGSGVFNKISYIILNDHKKGNEDLCLHTAMLIVMAIDNDDVCSNQSKLYWQWQKKGVLMVHDII